MKANLNHCLDLIGIAEAGYSNHPDDPGGPTNHGITRQTLEAWRKRYVSIQEVKDLTKEEAREILTSQYATPTRFDDLPLGLDYCVMDCSVNSGPSRAARILQEVLGMSEIDGIIGAHTLAVVAEENPPTLIDDYCTQRLAFMKTLKNWGTFKNGWTTRVEKVRSTSRSMTTGVVVTKTIALTPEGQAKASGAVKVISTSTGKVAIVNTAIVAGTVAAHFLSASYGVVGLAVASAAGVFASAMRR